MEKLKSKVQAFQVDIESGIFDSAWTKEIENMKKATMEKYVSKVHHNRIYQQTRTRRGGQKQILWATGIKGGKTLTCSTRDGLIEKLYELYSGLGPMNYKSTKLRDLFPAYIVWKSTERIKPKSLQEYTRLWKKFYENDEIAEMDAKLIKHKDWTNFFKRITAKYGLTEKALKQARIVASEMMRFCVEEEIIPFDPLGKTDYRRLPLVEEAAYNNVKATPFTEKEAAGLVRWAINEIKKPNVRPIYSFAIIFNVHMGLRYAELCGLRWEDIDYENKTVFVSGQAILKIEMNEDLTFTNKGRQRTNLMKSHEKPRLLPIPAEAMQMLEEIRKLGLSDEYIFPQGDFRYHTYNDKIKKGAAAIGLDPKKYHTHCLRSTAATNTYNICCDIKQVQSLLGHTTPEMTSKYIHDMRGVDILRKTMELAQASLNTQVG